MLILCIPTLPGCRDELKKPGYGYLMLPKVVKFKKSVDQLSPVRLCLGRLLQGNINKISVEGLLARGVNHSLEIPGCPFKKSEISYAECWSDLPLDWYICTRETRSKYIEAQKHSKLRTKNTDNGIIKSAKNVLILIKSIKQPSRPILGLVTRFFYSNIFDKTLVWPVTTEAHFLSVKTSVFHEIER